MKRQRTPPPRPTQADLQAAWVARRRDTWPATFSEAMNDPIYSRVIAIEARLALKHQAQAASARTPVTVALPIPSTLPFIDFKRLAAGERVDD